MLSCSGWMVATMSRIGPVRGRSISDSRIADASACWPAVGRTRSSSSYAVSCAGGEAEPAAPTHGHRIARPGLVEGQRHAGPPVDHHRLTPGLAGDVAAADVERLVRLGPQRGVVVEPAEEQRHARVVLQRLHPPVEGLLQVLGGDVISRRWRSVRPCAPASGATPPGTRRDGSRSATSGDQPRVGGRRWGRARRILRSTRGWEGRGVTLPRAPASSLRALVIGASDSDAGRRLRRLSRRELRERSRVHHPRRSRPTGCARPGGRYG